MANAFIQERELFPPVMPFQSGFLNRNKHEIYYEQCGNHLGQPVLFLHGGAFLFNHWIPSTSVSKEEGQRGPTIRIPRRAGGGDKNQHEKLYM